MKRIDIVKRAGRNLSQAKGRTFLTALAIAVGALTIMMSLAAGSGTRQYTQKLIESNVDPQTIIVAKGAGTITTTAQSTQGLQEYSESRDASTGFDMLTKDDITKITALDGADWVEPYVQVKADWVKFEGVVDKKYTMPLASYDAYVRPGTVAGSLPDKGKQIEAGEVVIPESFLKTLGKSANEIIGKKVVLTISSAGTSLSDSEMQQLYMTGGMGAIEQVVKGDQKDYTLVVRAVTKSNTTTGMTNSGVSATVNSKLAEDIADYTTKGTSQYEKYYSAIVRAKDGVDPTVVKDKIKASGDYDAMTTKEAQEMIFQFVNVLQYIVFGFGVLALIASIFGIINTQYISVLERTSQIGLMKALGMSNRGVGKLFRYEAAWIGLLGGVIGIGLAWVAVYFLNPWINTTLELGEENYLLKFEWLSALVLLVGLILIAIVAGWFPSRKAAKLDPIEALKTE